MNCVALTVVTPAPAALTLLVSRFVWKDVSVTVALSKVAQGVFMQRAVDAKKVVFTIK